MLLKRKLVNGLWQGLDCLGLAGPDWLRFGIVETWKQACGTLATMKFTQYFLHTRTRPDRRGIWLEWIQQVIDKPEAEFIQNDGRIRRWGRIAQAGGKYLRVVLLEDGETVHNAFFDRDFGEQHI